jgi:hypothetical protein
MALNLSHRRVLQNLQNDPYVKDFAANIQSLLGYPVIIEIDWASVESTVDPNYVFMNEARNIKEWFFTNLESGLKLVCSDNLGKEAVKAKIQKIKIFNTDNPGISLNGAVLDFGCSLRGNGAPGPDTIKDFLETTL